MFFFLICDKYLNNMQRFLVLNKETLVRSGYVDHIDFTHMRDPASWLLD